VKPVFSIFLLTVTVSLFYTGIGQVLPQLENHPPPEIAAGSDIGSEQLAEAGSSVFEANCVQCHKLGQVARGPDLAAIGGRAAQRAAERQKSSGQNYSDLDYLVESLCKPGDYLVSGFGNIMPPQGKQLTGGQLLAVAAFLQNLGGEATVTGKDTKPLERFGCGSGTDAGGGAAVAAASEPAGTPDKIVQNFGCSTCHALDSDERKLGPGFKGIGKRLSKGEIYEAVLVPDASIAKGTPAYPAGLMGQTLNGNGFYQRMTPKDYQALVDYLAKL
jgi:cytochrome c2